MRHTIPRATQSWTADSDHKLIQSVERYGTENWHLGMVFRIRPVFDD